MMWCCEYPVRTTLNSIKKIASERMAEDLGSRTKFHAVLLQAISSFYFVAGKRQGQQQPALRQYQHLPLHSTSTTRMALPVRCSNSCRLCRQMPHGEIGRSLRPFSLS